ncbi:hypothetical protein G6F31_020519 [Rhizopus arrhizus]|nr:hypothetical protein G6F31_020519 [Rhizopus arrhizus]
MRSASRIHTTDSESLGARQSPRGDSEPPDPTFGAFGTQVRLNWLVRKNRSRKIFRLRLMAARSYWLRATWPASGHAPASRSRQAASARKATLVGAKP